MLFGNISDCSNASGLSLSISCSSSDVLMPLIRNFVCEFFKEDSTTRIFSTSTLTGIDNSSAPRVRSISATKFSRSCTVLKGNREHTCCFTEVRASMHSWRVSRSFFTSIEVVGPLSVITNSVSPYICPADCIKKGSASLQWHVFSFRHNTKAATKCRGFCVCRAFDARRYRTLFDGGRYWFPTSQLCCGYPTCSSASLVPLYFVIAPYFRCRIDNRILSYTIAHIGYYMNPRLNERIQITPAMVQK